MASGYFPLRQTDDNGQRLLDAAAIIEAVCDDLGDSIYGGDGGQFDNAASDGGSLSLLRLAARLCRDEVR